jgi:hypothetical protein
MDYLLQVPENRPFFFFTKILMAIPAIPSARSRIEKKIAIKHFSVRMI